MAGLSHGMNLWKVDAPRSKKNPASSVGAPGVVRREFPRRVVIDVEERQPRAIVALGKLAMWMRTVCCSPRWRQREG